MDNLGERIKQLRKQKKRTLADIAGNRISVSMLSLIENNKSTPSMETLSYIAESLGINVSEIVSDENNNLTEQLWERIDDIVSTDGFNNPELSELIELNLDQIAKSVYGAKIFKIYAYLQVIKKDQELSRYYIKKAEDIYRSYGLMGQVLETRVDMAMFQFANGNYRQSLDMLIDIKKNTDNETYLVDNQSFNIRILYLLGSLYAAIGNLELAKQYLDESVNLASQTGDFSTTSETYRLRNLIAIFENEFDTYKAYIKKLDLLVKLTNKKEYKFSLYFSKMSYEYLINNDPLRVLGLYESYKYELKYDGKITEKIYNTYMSLLVGIAYFKLEEYERALSYFQLINTNLPLANHPIDICMRSELEAYKALIYQMQGDAEKALKHSEIATNATKNYPDNPYKKFIMQTYQDIKKDYLS